MAQYGTHVAGLGNLTQKMVAGMTLDGRHSRMMERSSIRYRGVLERIRGKAAASGRNEPCPCGSGRKYKKCCLARG